MVCIIFRSRIFRSQPFSSLFLSMLFCHVIRLVTFPISQVMVLPSFHLKPVVTVVAVVSCVCTCLSLALPALSHCMNVAFCVARWTYLNMLGIFRLEKPWILFSQKHTHSFALPKQVGCLFPDFEAFTINMVSIHFSRCFGTKAVCLAHWLALHATKIH